MQIQVHTDNHINGGGGLREMVESVMEGALSRFGDRIGRVDVHLADENSREKGGGNDMRCAIEARLAGLKPIAVTNQAASVDQAVQGAADKLERMLDHTLGRLDHPKGHPSSSRDQTQL